MNFIGLIDRYLYQYPIPDWIFLIKSKHQLFSWGPNAVKPILTEAYLIDLEDIVETNPT